MVKESFAQFPSNEYSVKLFDFFTRYEAFMLEAIPQTLRYFAPNESMDLGQTRDVMHDIFTSFAENFDEVLSLKDETLIKTYVIANTIAIILDFYRIGETRFVLPLCPQWIPLESSKAIYERAINRNEKIIYLFDKHRDLCETCTKQYEMCLSIMNENLGKKHSMLTSPYWLEKKQKLAEIYGQRKTAQDTSLLDSQVLSQKIENHKEKKVKFVLLPLCAAVILVLLTSSIYLLTTKQNQNNSLPITLHQPATVSTNQSLYDQLDLNINKYLELKNIVYLHQAKQTANQIESKYQDKYGIDLMAFYSGLPVDNFGKLLAMRKEMVSLISQPNGDLYNKRLNDSLELAKEFTSYNDTIEAYRLKVLIGKIYLKTRNFTLVKETIDDGLDFSIKNKYRFLEINFLLWQGKYFCEVPNIVDTESTFTNVMDQAKELGMLDVRLNAGMSLAAMYHRFDEDQKAFDLAKQLLGEVKEYKSEYTVQLLQVAGISASRLDQYDLANNYLKEAIVVSRELNNASLVIRSKAFLALSFVEQGKFTEADILYSEVDDLVNTIQEEDSKLVIQSIVIGYHAKAKLLQSDYKQALFFYQEKVKLFDRLKMISNLDISQTNKGIAICLEKLNRSSEAEPYLAKAEKHSLLARASNERVNCFLMIIPFGCKNK